MSKEAFVAGINSLPRLILIHNYSKYLTQKELAS